MISIHHSRIPPFLLESDFHRGLDLSDDTTFEVPEHCFKANASICSDSDLIQLLHTLRFWGVKVVPREVMSYIFASNVALQTFDEDSASLLADLDLVRKIFLLKLSEPDDRIEVAFRTHMGVEVLSYLVNSGHAMDEDFCTIAASAGDREVLRFAHECGCSITRHTILTAISSNQVDCLVYALVHSCEEDHVSLIGTAALGNVRCLKFLHEHGHKLTDTVCAIAAGCGSLECLQYAHENGAPFGGAAIRAARHHQVECFKYVLDHSRTVCAEMAQAAAHSGSLPCLQYAHSLGCVLDASVSAAAVCKGHLHCVEYVHAQVQGAAWDESITAVAAMYGQLECLRYLREHGCPWGGCLLRRTVWQGHWACVRYAVRGGCVNNAHIVMFHTLLHTTVSLIMYVLCDLHRVVLLQVPIAVCIFVVVFVSEYSYELQDHFSVRALTTIRLSALFVASLFATLLMFYKYL